MWKITNCLILLFVISSAWAGCISAIKPSTPSSQFTINSDGTVTDTKTGLMWKRCSEGQTYDSLNGSCSGSAIAKTWQQALQTPQILNASEGVYTDWRLPNIKELRSIVEEQCTLPAINTTVFPNTPASDFWSSSPFVGYSLNAWFVSFSFGNSYHFDGYRGNSFQVRLVRGGQE